MRRTLLLIALSAGPLAAEMSQVEIVVSDATTAVVPGAEVKLRCTDGWEKVVASDDKGVATIAGAPSDNCEVQVSRTGFKLWRQKLSGVSGRLEARLTISDIANTAEVRQKSAGRRFVDWLTSCTRK